MMRAADLAVEDRPAGPSAPNVYTLHLNPRDLDGVEVPAALTSELSTAFEATAADRGWLLVGPVAVRLQRDENVPAGTVDCRVETVPGPRPAWAVLVGADGVRHPLEQNRILIGRSTAGDLTIPDPEVSRRHALLWREGGEVWVVDLDSANGTTVDGVPVETPARVAPGAVIAFGPVKFTFRI